MKSYKIMSAGWVKLQPDLHIEEHDLTWDKLVNHNDGSHTVYQFDERQQEMIANCINSQIESLVHERMESFLKYARDYVGQGKLVSGNLQKKTCTELGITFDAALVDDFAVLLQQGYRKEAVMERMNLPHDVFQAVVQAYFATDGAGV